MIPDQTPTLRFFPRDKEHIGYQFTETCSNEKESLNFYRQAEIAAKLVAAIYKNHCQNPDRTTPVLTNEDSVKINIHENEIEIIITDSSNHYRDVEVRSEPEHRLAVQNDIYLLSEMLGEILEDATTPAYLAYYLNDITRRFLEKMRSEKPEDRPSLDNVLQFFNLLNEFATQDCHDSINEMFVAKLFLAGNGCTTLIKSINDVSTFLNVVIKLNEYKLLCNGVVECLLTGDLIPEAFSYLMNKLECVEFTLSLLLGNELKYSNNNLRKKMLSNVMDTLYESLENKEECDFLICQINQKIKNNMWNQAEQKINNQFGLFIDTDDVKTYLRSLGRKIEERKSYFEAQEKRVTPDIGISS